MRACLVSFSLLIFFSISVPLRVEAGLGVSPAVIINDRLRPESRATAILTVSRNNADATTLVHVDVRFPAGDWIGSVKGKDIEWKAGERQLLVPLSITVPANASFGTYNGDISVTEIKTKRDEQYSTQTVLGAVVQARLTVSNTAVDDFIVSAVTVSDARAPYLWGAGKIPGNLSLALTIQNVGNTPTRPAKVQLDIYDQSEKKVLEKIEIATIPEVPAFSAKDVVLELPHNLVAGEYVAYVKVFEGYRLTEGGERRVAFSVRTGAASHHFWQLIGVVFRQNIYILAVALLAIASLIIVRHTKRRNNSKASL